MSVTIGFHGPYEYTPRAAATGAEPYGILTVSDPPGSHVILYFNTPGEIDAQITALTALREQLTAGGAK